MMQPIYLPFTFVTTPIAEMLANFCKKVVVYQPSEKSMPAAMQHLEKQGLLSIEVPVKGEEDRFEKICKDYVAWLNLHSGSELEVLKIWKDHIPFFDETSSLGIRAEITKNLKDSGKEETFSPLFSARLFLHVAQDLDMKIWDIHHGLASVDRMEQELISRLRGEGGAPDPDHDAFVQMVEPAIGKMAERVRAWAYLYLDAKARRKEMDSDIFLTTSPSALEHLQEKATAFHEVFTVRPSLDTASRYQSKTQLYGTLTEKLVPLTTTPWPQLQQQPETVWYSDDSGRHITLTIYLVPDISPQAFFSRFVDAIPDATRQENDKEKNTIIGLVQT